MGEPETLQEAILYFSDSDNCVKYLASKRWPNGVVCPICGSDSVSAFNAKRRTWKCAKHHPKREFSVKVGTIFEDSAIGLDRWLAAVWMLTNCKNGVSSYEIARDLGVTQKTAWFMLHRIRLAMQDETLGSKIGGPGREVEADETFIGGKARNMHKVVKDRRISGCMENFWSLLKRGLAGTYVSVEPFHLFRYLDEQAFRFNNRAAKEDKKTDSDRFKSAVSSIIGKRLTFAELTGKTGTTTLD